ncbi:hypothetical protein QMO14_27375 [Variovorax sp. CAN2819]|nr:hypothetical protein [Variovorax sp. CAN15]
MSVKPRSDAQNPLLSISFRPPPCTCVPDGRSSLIQMGANSIYPIDRWPANNANCATGGQNKRIGGELFSMDFELTFARQLI